MESDYRNERLKELKIRNAKNKDRARAMEHRISQYLRGKRVPFSGAGSIKGDVLVRGKHVGGIIECKMSAGFDAVRNQATLIVSFSWLSKIKMEAELMRSLGIGFGALVFHYHGIKGDFVLIDLDACRLLCPDFEARYPAVIVKQYERRTFKLFHGVVLDWLREHEVVVLLTPIGAYQLMAIETFKKLLFEGCDTNNEEIIEV